MSHTQNPATTQETYNHRRLRELAAELNRPLGTLIALSDDHDPFLADRPGRRQDGAHWFADLWQRLDIPHGVHVRRLHYLLCSTPGIVCPGGEPYSNTHKCWKFLGSASADARFLDLVPAEAFVDRRAGEPIVYIPGDVGRDASTTIYWKNPTVDISDQSAVIDYTPSEFEFPSLPAATLVPPTVAERFAIELWAEKSTMNDILVPIAENRNVTLVTGVGELSVTHCHALVRRVRTHGRRTRILYISDFDMGGEDMPVSVGRKIEFFIRRDGGDGLDIRLNPLVLTAWQIAEYGLPKIPIKDSDPRKERFEARHGEGAVELDALEALHPGALRQIVEAAIDRYRAPTRRLRNQITRKAIEVGRHIIEARAAVLEAHATEIEALRDLWSESQTEIGGHQDAIAAAVARCEEAITEHQGVIEDELHDWQDRAAPVWERIAGDLEAAMPDLDTIEWPELDGEDDDDPLFDSARDYLTQMARYKVHQGKPADRVENVLTCEVCGRSFVSQRTTTKMCGRNCRNKRLRARNGGGAP